MKDLKKLQDILDAIKAIESYSVSTYDEFLSELSGLSQEVLETKKIEYGN